MVNKSENDNNVYDIICYYKNDRDENQDPNNVHDVINSIEQVKNDEDSESVANNFKTRNKRFENKWKIFGCFLMNILLSLPSYGSVTIFILHMDKLNGSIALIWIPIIFNATYLLVTPWLFNTITSFTSLKRNSNKKYLTNRSIIIIFTLIMSAAISLSGFIFSYLDANFLLILLLYSIIGGMSSCVILGKMFVIINSILRNEQLHLINFTYSLSTGVTQFIFPFITYSIMQCICYNCTIIIIGALLIHIIPISMLLIGTKSTTDEKSMRYSTGGVVELRNKNDLEKLEESRYSDISTASFNVHSEIIKYPSDVLNMDHMQWKNPSNYSESSALKFSMDKENNNDDHFLEILDSQRVMNSDGVEILETITEEEMDEEETKQSMENTRKNENMEQYEVDTMNDIDSIFEEINKKHEKNQQQYGENRNKFFRFRKIVIHKYESAFTIIYRQILNPLNRSLRIFQFYPSVILKSIDIFSYLLFVTYFLPNQATKQFQFEERENVIYLMTLMGLCWIIYSISALRFHTSINENRIHYIHFIGLLAKFFGYLFTNQRYSFNGFIFGIILISMGHANSFHLQETVIKNCFHPRKWYSIRGTIYSFSGFLILCYCIIFHIIHAYLSSLTFTNIFVLFNLFGILTWLLSNYEMVILICSKY